MRSGQFSTLLLFVPGTTDHRPRTRSSAFRFCIREKNDEQTACVGCDVLAHNLHARVVLESPIYSRDQLGAPVVVEWKTTRANVPARIQPIARRLEMIDGAGGELVTHLVYLTEWDIPSAQSRVRDISGRVFGIERIEQLDRLGELVELHVRRIQ